MIPSPGMFNNFVCGFLVIYWKHNVNNSISPYRCIYLPIRYIPTDQKGKGKKMISFNLFALVLQNIFYENKKRHKKETKVGSCWGRIIQQRFQSTSLCMNSPYFNGIIKLHDSSHFLCIQSRSLRTNKASNYISLNSTLNSCHVFHVHCPFFFFFPKQYPIRIYKKIIKIIRWLYFDQIFYKKIHIFIK